MAKADYRCCDVCDEKVFYDANLNYESRNEPINGRHYDLDHLGDWAVICQRCAETHEVVVRRKQPPETNGSHAGLLAVPACLALLRKMTARCEELTKAIDESAFHRALITQRDHFTSCDKTMGDSHACTCGASEYRKMLAALKEPT